MGMTALSSYGGSSALSALLTLGAAYLAYVLAQGLYNLTLHPLARFPGPKLAAFSKWYEFYFDVVLEGGGKYTWRILRMHEQYGPIVRINPDEIHVHDPDWYSVLYAGSGEVSKIAQTQQAGRYDKLSAGRIQRRNKYPPAANMAGTPYGIFGTVEHDEHRARRAAISSIFSRRTVVALQSRVSTKAAQLCDVLAAQAAAADSAHNPRGGVVELRTRYLAFAQDVTCVYALGAAPHPQLLPDTAWQKQWHATIAALSDLTPLAKHFAWALPVALKPPSRFWRPFAPDLAHLKELHEGMLGVAAAQRAPAAQAGRVPGKPRNIFDAIADSSLGAFEKSDVRVAQEGMVVVAAGGETVSRVLAAASFHLLDLQNRDALLRLREELDGLMPSLRDVPDLLALERLPWLTAVVKESLRIAAVILSRSPLQAPTKDLVFRDWVIPAGTPTSMSLGHLLRDPRCFDEPDRFMPERFLAQGPQQRCAADTYMFPFSKGGRACIGLNLAYAELYFAIAMLFRRFDMQLFDTQRDRDVEHSHDCFIGKPNRESAGVRVRLRLRTA